MALGVRLLGPPEVAVDGRPIQLTGRLQTLLLVLALSGGKTVSVSRLAEALWGDSLPANPRASVQTYITRLRNAVGAEPIGTQPPGYTVTAEVDAILFERLLDAQGGDERGRIERALSLWRGLPFEGTDSVWLQQVQAPRLVERYLAAAERLADLDLAAGRHAESVASLTDLLAQHPLRESLAARLMMALDGCGRHAEALEVYEGIRRRIAEQLGADPGPELSDLHLAVLVGRMPQPAPSRAPDPVVVPRQLPPDLACFAARTAELSTLDALLVDDALPSPTLAVIVGTAGIGKTALAVHWAHRVAEHFPDGHLYVNLRGFDSSGSPTPVSEAMRGFLDALGVGPELIPADVQAQTGMYRSLMTGKRMLLMLDNARDAEQVEPLLPACTGSLVVVTSRDRMTGLVARHGTLPVTLRALPATAARALIELRLGAERLDAEPEATEQIIDRCAGLPLALALVAARAALNPDFPLKAIVSDLDGGLDDDISRVLSWSYRALDPAEARLFRLLSLHPGSFGVAAAASLAALPFGRAARMLRDLAATHLITECGPARYCFHDLLRAYATELARTGETEPDRAAAIGRMVEHYLLGSHAAALGLDGRRRVEPLGEPSAGVVAAEEPADHGAAMAWFMAEHRVLTRVVGVAMSARLDTAAVKLAWALHLFQELSGHWQDAIDTHELALPAAARLGDVGLHAGMHRRLARVRTRMGQPREAEEHLLRAMELAVEAGDDMVLGLVHHEMAALYESTGRYTDALAAVRKELHHFRAAGHRRGEATALNGIGWFLANLGDYRAAMLHCREALAIHEELDNPYGQAATWDSLGFAHHHLGEHEQALESYHRSYDIYRRIGDRYSIADTLAHIGDTHLAAGDPEGAGQAWRPALEILSELGHAKAAMVAAKLAALAAG